jgi:hypothetical protein
MDTEPLVRDAPVTLNGLRFHYRDWGDPTALPVVMLYGFMGNARDSDTVAGGSATIRSSASPVHRDASTSNRMSSLSAWLG